MARRATDPGRLKSLRFGARGITIRLDLAPIDALAIDFATILSRQRVPYAIVSGYPAILLGRSRESEDVDILASPVSLARFLALHRAILRRLECLTPGTPERIYAEYLDAGRESTSVRYCEPGEFVPNVEFKFAKNALHRYSIANRIAVRVNDRRVHIGQLETQIAYKVWLGSPKDLEDARWTYRVAAGHIDETQIWRAARVLGITKQEVERALATH